MGLAKKIGLIFILSLWSGMVVSQNYIDLANFNYAITPLNEFDSTSTTTTLQEINGDLTVPFPVTDNFALLTGITYERITASFDPDREDESLTGLTLKVGANVKHDSKWSGTYMLLPKISSDLKNVSNRDFQVGGVLLMKYTKTAQFNYKFGLYGNSELFGPFLVPIFGFYYLSPSEQFEIKALLPLAADLNYSISESVRVGLNFKGQIRSYNINTPVETEVDRYLTKATNDIYIYFQYGTESGLNFQIGFGRSLGRSYRIYDEKVSFGMPLFYFGDDRTQLNSDFSDSWLFKIAAFYRLKLE